MNHHRMQQLLSAFADGELSNEEVSLVQNHLQQCKECETTLQVLRRMRDEIRSAAQMELPSNFAQQLLRTIRQQQQYVAGTALDLFARRLVLAMVVIVFVIVGVGNLNAPEQPIVIEPYLSGEAVDSTTTVVLTKGEITKEDVLLALSTR